MAAADAVLKGRPVGAEGFQVAARPARSHPRASTFEYSLNCPLLLFFFFLDLG